MSQSGQTAGILWRVVGLGDPVMDVRVEVSHDVLGKLVDGTGGCLPISASEMQRLESVVQDLQHIRVPGGSAANVMKGLANMSDGEAHCTFVGMIGQDTTGREYKNKLASQGVQPLLLENRGGEPSATALCLVTPDGQRTMRTCLGASLELRSIDMLPTTWLAGVRLLHCEGYCLYRRDLARQAMMAAKQAGAIVSLDLASYELVRNCRDLLLELLQDSLIDLVFANEHEALELVTPLAGPQQLPEADMEGIIASAQRMLLQHVEVAVVSRGPKGCVASSRGGLAASSPAAAVTVVDTIGAGDTFAAGFLHAYLQGTDLQACCECGCAAGAEAVQAVGADLPAASWDRLRRSIAPILAAGLSRWAKTGQNGEPMQGDSPQDVTGADGQDLPAVPSEQARYDGIQEATCPGDVHLLDSSDGRRGGKAVLLNGHDATVPGGHEDASLLNDDDASIPPGGDHGAALSAGHDNVTQRDGQPDVLLLNDDAGSIPHNGHHDAASSNGHVDATPPDGHVDALLLCDGAGSIPPTEDDATASPGGFRDSLALGGVDNSIAPNQHVNATPADSHGDASVSKANEESISPHEAASPTAHTMDTPAPQPPSSTAEPAMWNDISASLPPTSAASVLPMTGSGGSAAAAGEVTPAASPSRQAADKENPPTAHSRSQEARESAMERSRRTLERGQRALALSQQVLAAGQQLAAGHVRQRLPTNQHAAAQQQPSTARDATGGQPVDSLDGLSLRPDQHVAANGQPSADQTMQLPQHAQHVGSHAGDMQLAALSIAWDGHVLPGQSRSSPVANDEELSKPGSQVHAVHADATSASVPMPSLLAASQSVVDSQGRDQDQDLDLNQQAKAAAAGSLPSHDLPGAVAEVSAAAPTTDKGAQHRGGTEVQHAVEPRVRRPRRRVGLMLTATAGVTAAIVRILGGRA